MAVCTTVGAAALFRCYLRAQKDRKLDPQIEEQFGGGRLLAFIASRPDQYGRADGYILEDKELEFYMKKIQKGKGAT
ncbi:hypothetical protein HN51_051686 [Arachis hypogaea]